ncbi:conserved hypothetical protein [Mesorhizobium plurifarium]|uniref:Uncharacterized protein n=1 Tax=Mesorhizobium plurifarium TaxID=69974 RepID=A0A090EFA7_MESPL|nr:conserved hypothetical protein [Mesorhizobium plurifarium]
MDPVIAFFWGFWSFAKSRVGLPIVVAGAIIFYYEGVPLGPIRNIPWVGPALSGLVDGRVDREYAAGQKTEEAIWQEKMRFAAMARDADLKKQQANVDAAAQKFADSVAEDKRTATLRIADLEERIRQQKEEDDAPKPAGDVSGTCKPGRGIAARLSIGIDNAGR